MMTTEQLRTALQNANLSRLARHSGVTVRTLRRIKNQQIGSVMASTIERVQPHLKRERSAA
jgi:AraC-like DNA-binding protein